MKDRFWEKVERLGPFQCWNWTSWMDRDGYGLLTVGSTVDNTYRMKRAHRISWEIHYGPIERKDCVLHSCDNRACVNPAHLFLGTRADNAHDMDAKGRRVVASKITPDQVREVRRRAASGESQQVIARAFGITQANVSCIHRRVSWKHLE